MQRATLDPANQTGRPVNLQVGHGVRPIAVSRIFSQGNLQRTDNPQDFAIEGEGFFAIQRGNEILYTKDGTFKLVPGEEGLTLTTSEGFIVLNTQEEPIVFSYDDEIIFANVTIDDNGNMFYGVAGEVIPLDNQLMLVQFPNPQGLEGAGSNLLRETSASGQPLFEFEGDVPRPSRVLQGALEMSNVSVADEMVNLIVAQRAFELNSKAITTSDEMLQTANNLKR
jgi:flagellar basal-body rod protein FlgG